MKKQTSDFFFEYYDKNSIPNIYSSVLYSQDQKIFENNKYLENKNKDSIYSIMFIPNYILPNFDRNNFAVKKISQFFKGYSISLNGIDTVDQYIRKRFKKNAKSILKRVKRLESCFKIDSTFYYGEITKTEYDFF